jgi:hypothetical protein
MGIPSGIDEDIDLGHRSSNVLNGYRMGDLSSLNEDVGLECRS